MKFKKMVVVFVVVLFSLEPDQILAQDSKWRDVNIDTLLAKGNKPDYYLAYAIPRFKNKEAVGNYFLAHCYQTSWFGGVSRVDIGFSNKTWVSVAYAEASRVFYGKQNKLENPKQEPFQANELAILVEVDGKIRFRQIEPTDLGDEQDTQIKHLLELGQLLFVDEWKAYQKSLKTPGSEREHIDPAHDPLRFVLLEIYNTFSLRFDKSLISPQTTKKGPVAQHAVPGSFLRIV